MPPSVPCARFTPAELATLPATGKSYDVSDAAVAGLVLRVGPQGKKRWLFRFKWKRQTSRIKIGPLRNIGVAQARKIALRFREDLDSGIDPRCTARPTARRSSGVIELRPAEPLL
jgi:hypothetical protein